MTGIEGIRHPDFLTRDADGFIHPADHRIGLHHVVRLYEVGYSAEMLQAHYPTLPLALIYKVIAFYLENESFVNAYIPDQEKVVAIHGEMANLTPSVVALRRRLADKQAVEVGVTPSEK